MTDFTMPLCPPSKYEVPPKENKFYNKALQDLLAMMQHSSCSTDRSGLSYGVSQLELSNEHVEERAVNPGSQDLNSRMYTETDVTLPSHLAAITYTDPSIEISAPVKQNTRKTRSNVPKGPLPPDVHEIYEELLEIYQKLQGERESQQEYSHQLKKRQQYLQEEMIFKHQVALGKIKDVEEIVYAKFQRMKEQHDAEAKQLSDALKEKIKENKRLKSSFDTLKEMNDNLKKQLNEVSEQNKTLETQAKKVQARLENLQKKHAYLTVQKCKPVSYAQGGHKLPKVEKPPAAAKYKVPNSVEVYELLAVLMDWISEQQVNKSKSQESESQDKALCANNLSADYTQEKCVKILPVLVEQFQWMPLVNTKLHLAFMKFIYWTLRQMENKAQCAMTSTLRRLGEEAFKGVQFHPSDSFSMENIEENNPKSAAFFKSNDLPLRFVSTLVILKTVTQVDYLAQALDTLCMDLKCDEGRALFLEYQSASVVLNLLSGSNRCLASHVLDILLQLSMETRFLQPFLESCSRESFFKVSAVLLRDPKSDIPTLEKLSIVLQKLSKVRSNKKFFELFNIPSVIQELQRSANPDRAFLIINLNSILFHLGFTKANNPVL